MLKSPSPATSELILTSFVAVAAALLLVAFCVLSEGIR